MEKHLKERMDGLVLNQIASNLRIASRILKEDFLKEGFEDFEINEYIGEIVK